MARDSAGRFARSGGQAKAVGDAIRQVIADAVKMLILEIDANLRETTPVDTGHARANWVPSIGSPHQGEDDGAAHDQGIAAVLAYQLTQGPGYVSNHVPYISALNYGHSKQAPRMFVEAAVDKALATVSQRFAGKIDVSSFDAARGALAVGRAMMAFQ